MNNGVQKPYTLIIPSWYPDARNPLNGIFIKKHTEAISTFRNVVVMYITGYDTPMVEEKRLSDSLTEYKYYYKESSSRGFNQIKYIWSQIRAYNYLRKKYGRPSLVHLHVVFPAGIFVYLLLLIADIPLLITEHWTGYTDEDGRYKKQSSLLKSITASLFRKARKVSVVSEYFKKVMLDWKLIPADRLITVYNTLNTPQAVYHYSPDKAMKALYVGYLADEQKNISMLINAVEIVVRKYPDFQLSLVGGGSETEKFVRMVKDKGLERNVIFRGFVANALLPGIYQEHGFFVLASNFETFSIAAAEAMMSGLPVVSTKCGGPTEFVNEHTGIWIKQNTAEDTSAAMMEMIECRDRYDSPRIARETQEKFSDATILSQLKGLYESGQH